MSQSINQIEVPTVLSTFDQLPDCASVRLPVVMALYACSPATIWRGVRSGIIPKPRKLTPRTTTWLVGDLRHALAKHMEEHMT